MKKTLLSIVLFAFSNTINAQCFGDIFLGAHAITKKSDGSIWGWGQSDYGQLHTNNGNDTEPLPIQVGNQSDWLFVKNRGGSTFAIKNNGTLWGCGSNQFGSLGINSSTQQFVTFQQITTSSNWVKVAPSTFFTIALKTDGTVWAWGQNDEYQLGISPATAQQLFPIQVGTATDWVDIATGTNRTAFAIKSNGTIWGWGSNSGYLLYFGSSVSSYSSPTQINTSTDWVKMSVGAAHILAQKQDGTLWSWGNGPILGVGNVPSTTTPQQVTTATWKSFSAGPNVSFGIKSDGTLWSWGNNSIGQLGDGTTNNQLFPNQIGVNTNWEKVETNGFTTIASRMDGTVWAWGRNNYGAFGNGTYTDSIVPLQITNICTALTTPTFEKEIALSLFPNPAKDVVSVQYNLDVTKAQLEVYDIAGRSISTNVLSSSVGDLQLNTSSYPSGIYIVVVKQDGVLLAQKKLLIE